MFRQRTDDEIRRYDLMKLGVLLLLLALLALTWIATRETESGEAITDQPAPTLAAATSSPAATPPTAPSVDVPDETQSPGSVAISGMAPPGAQVLILVDGRPAGAAIAGVDGAWATAVELPAGEYSVQARTVDNVGTVVGESAPVNVVVGETASAFEPALPRFDSLTGTYTFDGTTVPGDTITLTNNGAPVGTATADEAGNWSITVPADAVSGDVAIQTTDAAGTVTQQTETVKLGPPPPNVELPAGVTVDPASGSVVVPSQPDGLTLSGQGEPGTQVELLVDGARGGLAPVDANGAWSLPVVLADGAYTLQLNSLDPGGGLLAAGEPFAAAIGQAAVTGPTPSGDGTPAAETTPAAGATPAADATPVAGATPTAGAVPANQTLGEMLGGQAEFSTFLSILDAAGMGEMLAGTSPLTIFAPTNEAFDALPPQVVDTLRANPQVVMEILQYHITAGRYTAADLRVVQPATLNGLLLTVTPQGDTFLVNDALVTAADLEATNGIAHAIDRILVPPLEPGVQPLVIDDSGVPTFVGPQLTVVGSAQPGTTVLIELNGEPFGQPATVGPDSRWAISGEVTPGDYQIMGYMLDSSGGLMAISRPVALQVR